MKFKKRVGPFRVWAVQDGDEILVKVTEGRDLIAPPRTPYKQRVYDPSRLAEAIEDALNWARVTADERALAERAIRRAKVRFE